MAMVVRANKKDGTIGGHISTFASSATLYEVGFNHFFRGPDHPDGADQIYFQGHASPGIYARAFLEGRLGEEQLHNFRQELAAGGGLSSYPHPWLMPDFWQFPTVSMGLGPIMAIYQARFNRYLEHRGLKKTAGQHVWCFIGDGECDEPESLGAITLASREELDNLIFVINCNLQRLDGPVRGNGKIIQELEAAFRGAGWNCIKVIWGGDWDTLLERDKTGLLVQRMGEVVDGEYQKYTVAGGAYIREHFFGKYPELLKLVEHLSDEQLDEAEARRPRSGEGVRRLQGGRGTQGLADGHPGPHHQGLRPGRSRRGQEHRPPGQEARRQAPRRVPQPLRPAVPDEAATKAAFYKPAGGHRGDSVPQKAPRGAGRLPADPRRSNCPPLQAPGDDFVKAYAAGSGDKKPSTTGVFVDMLASLLRDKDLGKWIVPIVPDEARTFGMDPFFSKYKIYSNVGQLYEPVDAEFQQAAYREAKDGQILEEGITEAGSMSSFIAAGTAYATHGVPTIPFYIYYSMFGFQRIGDLIWAAADLRTRGFLLGATAGRTTLNGEGLQHEDGHSHSLASTVPNRRGLRPGAGLRTGRHHPRRHPPHVRGRRRKIIFYYITLYNENYPMPPMPEGSTEGILKGLYKLRPAANAKPQGAEGRTCSAAGRSCCTPCGAGAAGRAFRRGGRRLERDELQGAAARGAGGGALEPAAPDGEAATELPADAAGEGRRRRSWRPATTCGRCRR